MDEKGKNTAGAIDTLVEAIVIGKNHKNWNPDFDSLFGDTLVSLTSKNHPIVVNLWYFEEGIARAVSYNSQEVYANGFDQNIANYESGKWEELLVS